MKPNSAKFKALQAEWDKKLEDSGFVDIENREHGSLKSYHSMTFFNSSNRHQVRQQNKQEYYRQAGQFLYSHTFETADEYNLWKLHCEGETFHTYRSPKVRCTRTTYNIISRLAKIMAEQWKK